MEWDFGKTTKKCTNCNKVLPADEFFYSALFFLRPDYIGTQDESVDESKDKPAPTSRRDGDERFIRRDYCSTCWDSKPESVSRLLDRRELQPTIQTPSGGAGQEPLRGVGGSVISAKDGSASGMTLPFKLPSYFSYWKTKITLKQAPKTPREVLVEFFDNMISAGGGSVFGGNPAIDKSAIIDESIRSKIIYLFSLILLRRKIFKIKESIQKDNQPFIVFERVPDGKVYEVAELNISDAELVSLKDQFSKLFEFDI